MAVNKRLVENANGVLEKNNVEYPRTGNIMAMYPLDKLVVNDRFTTSTVAYDTAIFANEEAIEAAIEAGTVYGKPCEVTGYKGCIELTKTAPTGKVGLKAVKFTTIPNGDAGIKFAVIKAD